jgi:hypothetical protein
MCLVLALWLVSGMFLLFALSSLIEGRGRDAWEGGVPGAVLLVLATLGTRRLVRRG